MNLIELRILEIISCKTYENKHPSKLLKIYKVKYDGIDGIGITDIIVEANITVRVGDILQQ